MKLKTSLGGRNITEHLTELLRYDVLMVEYRGWKLSSFEGLLKQIIWEFKTKKNP